MIETDTVTAFVIDDEALGRKKICRMLKDDPEIQLIGDSAGGTDAVVALHASSPDLLFLDVNMPEMDGFRLLEEIDGMKKPFVIFVTAYDQFALKAFQVHALDYLLKPFDSDRFYESVNRAKTSIRQSRTQEVNHNLMALLQNNGIRSSASAKPAERIMVKANGSISFLRSEEIDWVEAQGAYVCLYAQGKKHLLREKISDLESQLRPDQFVRIHRSTIVNIDRIKEMQPLFYGEYAVILHDGTKLTLSRSLREKVLNHLSGACQA